MPYKDKKKRDENAAEYRERHREKLVIYAQEYYKLNREKVLAWMREYYRNRRETEKAYSKEYYYAHKEQVKKYQKRKRLMRAHNLTIEEYDNMFNSQNGVCAICNRPPSGPNGNKLMVDHDHATNKTRGLLCSNCNLVLGFASDSIEIMSRAIVYLEKYSKP